MIKQIIATKLKITFLFVVTFAALSLVAVNSISFILADTHYPQGSGYYKQPQFDRPGAGIRGCNTNTEFAKECGQAGASNLEPPLGESNCLADCTGIDNGRP